MVEARNMLEYIESGKVTDEATRFLDNEVTEARLKEAYAQSACPQ